MIRAGILLLLGVAPLAGAAAADLRGQVTLVSATADAAAQDASDTVVFFKPDSAVRVRPLAGDLAMTMQGKSFVPHVLTVTAGSTVRFPNTDPILHNVFSTSTGNDFDMGLYGHGGGKTKVFGHPGLVRVYCNVHHEMFAYILVLDTPYFADAGADGSFELRGLPAGPGEVTVWNPRGEVWRQHLDASPAAPLAVQLKLNRFGVPEHFNKFGKPYDKNATPGY
jgi:plastocyanin